MATPTPAQLDGLSAPNREAILRLASLPATPRLPAAMPTKGQAAVAVILFQTRSTSCAVPPTDDSSDMEPELHVICSTRAMHLSSHPGQASLPGGKVDRSDVDPQSGQLDVAMTAIRETCEEVGLDPRAQEVGDCVHLYTARPFLSKTALLVHPVIYFLPPRSAYKTLSSLSPSPDEVDLVWSYPLRALLSSKMPTTIPAAGSSASERPLFARLSDPSSVDRHRPPQETFRTYSDVPWLLAGHYRLHRFRSPHQLVKGLTADVLIHCASLAYDCPPRYAAFSPDQASWDDCVAYLVKKRLAAIAAAASATVSQQRPTPRWGDGESGDAYGSMEKFATVQGRDDDYLGEAAAEAEAAMDKARKRDEELVRRSKEAPWHIANGNGHYPLTEEQQIQA
ncbi:hypothetical protein FA10DRAFT_134000 [Acaromyces ingoldii]|uniref:Nudix hydrolase domain-containing protein n=1 Tax=Acaromyces ingoldii TaxID=215250 RepID=A0A316YLP0_9BASI|nr:hypothetical protein FA10DRAFT_134000 [Acaromyces ingoldii]PWN88983.1 hypothetical protein FA10DRAFT_134000 [Acaromyces ingoldii]